MKFMEIDIPQTMKHGILRNVWDAYQELITEHFDGYYEKANGTLFSSMLADDLYNVVLCIRYILKELGYTEYGILLKEVDAVEKYFKSELEFEKAHGSHDNRISWIIHSMQTLESYYVQAIKKAKQDT